MPLLWALGWTVTTAGGIDVDQQFAVFGAYGAITFMALSGVLLDRLRATTPAARPAPGPTRRWSSSHPEQVGVLALAGPGVAATAVARSAGASHER